MLNIDVFVKSQNEYDLVTCSFTLLDLPNRLSRLENIERLWKALANDGYLVQFYLLIKLVKINVNFLFGHIFVE